MSVAFVTLASKPLQILSHTSNYSSAYDITQRLAALSIKLLGPRLESSWGFFLLELFLLIPPLLCLLAFLLREFPKSRLRLPLDSSSTDNERFVLHVRLPEEPVHSIVYEVSQKHWYIIRDIYISTVHIPINQFYIQLLLLCPPLRIILL